MTDQTATGGSRLRSLRRDKTRREHAAEGLGRKLDPLLVPLGFVWAFAVLLNNDCWYSPIATPIIETIAWAAYPVFVAEFIIRWVVHPSTWRFVREQWWEIPILALPFLRFARVLRVGRAVGGMVRTSRTSGQRLRKRLEWLGLLHVIIILGATSLLCDFGGYAHEAAASYSNASYLRALHDAAFAATSGEPLSGQSGLARGLEIALATWSVLVFAALAGAIGEFFLSSRQQPSPPNA